MKLRIGFAMVVLIVLVGVNAFARMFRIVPPEELMANSTLEAIS